LENPSINFKIYSEKYNFR